VKNLVVILGVTIAMLASSRHVLADDLWPPEGRGAPGTLAAEWDSWTGFGSGIMEPDAWQANPPGLAAPWGETAAETEFLPVFEGRQNVLKVPDYLPGLEIGWTLDNYDQSRPWKAVQVQFTWFSDANSIWADFTVWTDAGGPYHPEATLIHQYYDPVTDWETVAYAFALEPNPAWERIEASLEHVAGWEVYVDQVVIDTWCAPEPVSASILGLGAVALLRRRRRRA